MSFKRNDYSGIVRNGRHSIRRDAPLGSGSNSEITAARSAGNVGDAAATLSERIAWAARGHYNVLAYGATGSGSTSDATANTTAIQAALDAVPSTGGVVFVPAAAGEYYVDPDTSLNIDDNTTLYIEKGATIRAIGVSTAVNQILNVNDVDNVRIIGGGIIQGDKYSHDLATGADDETTLDTALTGGESSIDVATGDGSLFSAGDSIVIVADNGDWHLAVGGAPTGDNVPLQTDVPSGFAAAIGNTVYIGGGAGGMGLRIENSTNVVVDGLTFKECWGDGIYITEYERSTDVGSKDIWILDCFCDDNRRNGLSVVGGKRVRIIGGSYSNSQGNQPQHGIDIEPSSTYECDDIFIADVDLIDNERDGLRVLGPAIADVRVSNCLADGNADSGFAIHTTSNHVIEGCLAKNNGDDGYTIGTVSGSTQDTDGNRLINCHADDNTGYGFNVTNGNGSYTTNRSVLTGCHATSNGTGGFYLNDADLTGIENCEATSNSSRGMDIDSSSEVAITGGSASLSSVSGIRVTGGSRNSVSGVQVHNNNRDGVQVTGSTKFVVRNCEFFGNGSETDDTYDQLNVLNGADDGLIFGNVFLLNANANQPAYDINIQTADCDNVKVGGNDWSNGAGQTLNFRDNGTGTDNTTIANYT